MREGKRADVRMGKQAGGMEDGMAGKPAEKGKRVGWREWTTDMAVGRVGGGTGWRRAVGNVYSLR